jgi:hypothetical protein
MQVCRGVEEVTHPEELFHFNDVRVHRLPASILYEFTKGSTKLGLRVFDYFARYQEELLVRSSEREFFCTRKKRERASIAFGTSFQRCCISLRNAFTIIIIIKRIAFCESGKRNYNIKLQADG